MGVSFMVAESIADKELKNGATIRYKGKTKKVSGTFEEIEKEFPDFYLLYCGYFMKVAKGVK